MDWHLTDLLFVVSYFLGVFLVIVLPLEMGFRVGRRKRLKSSDDGDQSIGVFVAAILGMLAFMLAFTFNMAASRYETRRQVVLEEANDIGTTYLRTSLLPEPSRSELRELLKQYVDIRVKAVQSGVTPAKISEAIADSEKVLDQAWKKAMEPVRTYPTPITGLFVQALNKMIDTHSKRVMAGVKSRIPFGIWFGLFGLAVLGLSCAGYQAGVTSKERPLVMIGLVLAFAGVLTLIADLDHPVKGLLQAPQGPMESLYKHMALR